MEEDKRYDVMKFLIILLLIVVSLGLTVTFWDVLWGDRASRMPGLPDYMPLRETSLVCADGTIMLRRSWLDENGEPGWVAFYAYQDGSDEARGPFLILDIEPDLSTREAYFDRNADGAIDEKLTEQQMLDRFGTSCGLLNEIEL